MSFRPRAKYGLLFGGPVSRGVKALLIINGVVFIFQLLEGLTGTSQLTSLLGLQPISVWRQLQVWRLMTYLFLHAGFFHILINMLLLYFFGPELERIWGTRGFLKYYFMTGIGAGIFTLLVGPFSQVLTIGASGAIYGVLLAYGLYFPNRLVYIYAIFPVKVKYMVMGMAVIAFFGSVGGARDGIAHWTHLSGLAVGFVYLMGGQLASRWKANYHRWKLKRAKSKFQVYYRETRRSPDDKDHPTIH